MKKNKPIAVLLLSLMLCPPLIPLTSLQGGPGGPQLLTSSTSISTDTVTLINDTEELERTLTVETWTNGTLLHFSTRIPNVQDMTLNYTTWVNIPEEGLSKSTTASTPSVSGRLPTLLVDNLQFLGKASNGTWSTSYVHDNNYEVYYPLQWDLPYALAGLVDNHIHLWSSLLNSWIAGNLTHAFAIIAGLATGKLLETLLSVSEDEIVAEIAAWLDCPWVIALWAAYEIYDIINQIAQILGYVSTAAWVYNTVMEHFSSDGWMWASPAVLVYSCWRLTEPYYYKPFLWKRYYEVRAYNQSWGVDGPEYLCSNKHEISLAYETQDIAIAAPAGVWYCERGNAQPR
jgi:hypothetical protein